MKGSGKVESEIQFSLHVEGAESWSWADIRNNGAVKKPGVNLWNELQAERVVKTTARNQRT